MKCIINKRCYMEDNLLVFEISFNLEVFLMKAPRGRIFLINSGLFNLSFVMEIPPRIDDTSCYYVKFMRFISGDSICNSYPS